MSCLKGKRVLEIGTNAGLSIWTLFQRGVESYTGIEPSWFYRELKATARCLSSKTGSKSVQLYSTRFYEFAEDCAADADFDALYASFVLYHLSDYEVGLLKEKVLPRCNVVVIPTRFKERRGHKNSFFLNRESSVRELVTEAGFSTVNVYTDAPNGQFVLVAKRDGYE
jgi:hypothetical protein